MKNDYIIFAINEVKKALINNSDTLYIGYDDFHEKSIRFDLPLKSWNEFMNILKEYALEEECYENINELSSLQEEVRKHVDNYNFVKTSLNSEPRC